MRAVSRRRYRRMTLRVHVDYRVGDEVRSDDATTLGAGGLFIATEDPLDEGTHLVVSFTLRPQGVRHEIDARVVWSHRPEDEPAEQSCGMGICFTHPAAGAVLAAELEGLAADLDGDTGRET